MKYIFGTHVGRVIPRTRVHCSWTQYENLNCIHLPIHLALLVCIIGSNENYSTPRFLARFEYGGGGNENYILTIVIELNFLRKNFGNNSKIHYSLYGASVEFLNYKYTETFEKFVR